jgi:hypothetical protein
MFIVQCTLYSIFFSERYVEQQFTPLVFLLFLIQHATLISCLIRLAIEQCYTREKVFVVMGIGPPLTPKLDGPRPERGERSGPSLVGSLGNRHDVPVQEIFVLPWLL